MKKIALLLALALVLGCACASADTARGDRGEEVRFLQWLLQKTGWLNDKADGVFGPRTEQAIRDYQNSRGYEETGVADEALLREIDRERTLRDKQANGQDYYEPYPGNYAPTWAADYAAPFHCQTTALKKITYRDYCIQHLEILKQEYALTEDGSAEGLREAAELWLAEIERMYGEWADSVPANQREGVLAVWEAWQGCFAAQADALNACYGDPVTVQQQRLVMLKNFAGVLCELRSGDLPAAVANADLLYAWPGEPEEGMPEVETEAPASCEQWTLGGGTEFFTCCEAHAKQFKRENSWLVSEERDAEKINTIIEKWLKVLSKQYKQLKASCSGEGAALVVSARKSFIAALDAQNALIGNGDAAMCWQMVVLQMENVRLCRLLNGQ